MTIAHHDDERSSMNRRMLLAAGTSAGTVLAAPQVARAQSAARELRMTTAWPKGSAGLGANAQRLADMINAMSGGRLKCACSPRASSCPHWRPSMLFPMAGLR